LSVNDIPAFVEMRIAQLLEEGASETVDLRPALVDYYARHLADDTFASWLALDDDRIVATSGISVVEKPPYFGCPTGRIALVSSMFTNPAYRRRGIAHDLLCRVLEEARSRDCGVVQITASNAGVPLYESVGFKPNANFRQISL
ncbi:MAG: GNAT family N-acetyltransferase, partial [Atopobiaceae bacterium]|nr:GNAT family N-acetyltransferase [Atopobiaceae bacterium]